MRSNASLDDSQKHGNTGSHRAGRPLGWVARMAAHAVPQARARVNHFQQVGQPCRPRKCGMDSSTPLSAQPRNPLHGITLEMIVKALAGHYGWAGLAQRVPVGRFSSQPSVASSLKFLRKTPWASEKVESLYLFVLREQRRDTRH